MINDASHARRPSRPGSDELVVRFQPRGPDPATVERLIQELPRHPSVEKLLGGKHQFLSFHLIDPDPPRKASAGHRRRRTGSWPRSTATRTSARSRRRAG